MISYKKLFHILIERNMKQKELIEGSGVTATILNRIKNGETIKTDAIDKICRFLKVQPGDIMDYTED